MKSLLLRSGLRTRKKSNFSLSQSPRTFQNKKFDVTLLITVICLSLFGMLMVYDSSQVQAFSAFGDKYYFIKQQVIWMGLGFSALGFFAFFDYRRLRDFATPFLGISLLFLLLVFIPGLGVAAGGAHRWLKIGFITIQPTEIIKLSSIIFLAALFPTKTSNKTFLILLGAVTVIIGIFQKDLGSAIVFSLICLAMYFISGAPFRYLLTMLFLGVSAFVVFVLSSSYRKDRILAFLDPLADPQGFSYHIFQVLIALGSGGLFGLGIGQSRQKFAYIPEVTTDSIFSVVGEEFGFIGALILISVIAFLVIRGFKIAENATDDFGKFVGTGLSFWLGIQAMINLGAMVSLIPLTGVPLPFISYGGSALLMNLVAIGILLNISRQQSL